MRHSLPILAAAIALASALTGYAETTDDRYMLTLLSDATPAGAQVDPDWADQIKKPTSWLTWGADQRLRLEYFDNAITLNEHRRGHEWDFGRFRTRLWGTVAPCKEFEVTGRLNWEWRDWVAPNSKPDQEWNQVTVENLYTKLKPLPELTITLGRQDIIMGDGWLILDGTPLDGSTTIYFDALCATYDAKPIDTTFDAIFIQQFSDPDMWLPTINDTDHAMVEQDELGGVLYATNKSIKNTQIDGYFIYKQDDRKLGNGDQGEIYTFGGRVVEQFTENLKGRIEGAGQFGHRSRGITPASGGLPEAAEAVCAFGLTSRLTYSFNDNLNNQVYLNFEYLSGDNPGTGRDEAFDPLWGRWPQFSELYVYSYATETRIAETTNLLRLGPGYTVFPMPQMQLEFTYHALFANQNTLAGVTGFSEDGNFRGQLMTAILRYKFNSHVSTHLWGEYFVPGDYYDSTKGDNAVYLRAEVVLSF